MEKIQMVDLVGQYEKIKKKIDESILNVIKSSQYINGPEVHSFQEELEDYLDVKHVIPCANGTDAIQIALMALGLEEGDEVITTNFTFVATVEVIKLLNLTPVLVDVCPDTFNINPEKIKQAITDKTKVILPVHLFGQPCDMGSIMQIAKDNNLYVIEDTAQAIGSNYTFEEGIQKKSGTIGDFGTTSFFPSKNLGCYGDGGALFTNDEKLAEIARSIANHGQDKRYYHNRIGVNSRLDSIQATILRAKLPFLDSYNQKRKEVADAYDIAFSKLDWIQIPKRNKNSTHVFHQYTLKVKDGVRESLIEYLKEKNIPVMVYYPLPIHRQKAYEEKANKNEKFPVTNELCKNVLSLPIHTEFKAAQLEYIITTINKFEIK